MEKGKTMQGITDFLDFIISYLPHAKPTTYSIICTAANRGILALRVL